MIKFTHIRALDTFSYRELNFDFRSGLSSVAGANGASKTSIFMALQIGLFNRCAKGCKIDEASNNITTKPFEITVEFTKGNEEYRVENSRKKGRISVFRDGVDISLQRIPENLQLISEILGCDYATFVDLTYQSKESTLNLLETSTDKGRKEFIARILKLEEIDAQQARMKEKEKELAGKYGRIQSLTSSIATLESSFGETLEIGVARSIEAEEIELCGLNTEVENLTKELARAQEELKSVQKEVKAWEAERELRKQLVELQREFDSTAAINVPAFKQLDTELWQTRVHLDAELKGKQTLLTQLRHYHDLRQAVAEKQEQLALLVRPEKSAEECQEQQEKIGKAYSNRKGKIERDCRELKAFQAAAAKGQCPTCGGQADVSQQIEALTASLTEDKAFVEKCETSSLKYANWINSWKKIQKVEGEIRELQAELRGAPEGEINEVAGKILELAEERDSTQRRWEEVREELRLADDREQTAKKILELQALLTRDAQCLYDFKYEENLKTEVSGYQHRLSELQQQRSELNKTITENRNHNAKVLATQELNRQVTESNQKLSLQLDGLKKELEACESKLDLLKEWQGVLGSKGYRVARIKTFLGSLNSLIVKHAQRIADGRIQCVFYINEAGEIVFKITDEAKSMPYELWSGGEKARVKMVCLFAVLELLGSMGSLNFNVMALDEIFSALDAEGKEGLFAMLTYLKSQGKAIYTIAHEELVLELQYDYQVVAKKLGDGTTEVGYV